MSHFQIVDPHSVDESAFRIIGSEWMLLTAGNHDSFNSMTAAWGGFGTLWEQSVCFCFVRPVRYTYEFFEKSNVFSLCFFDEKYRSVLDFCGSHSGRSTDKVKATGITPVRGEKGTVYYDEARLVFLCEKIYYQDIIPAHFLDSSIHKHYPKKDYHRMYVGRVIQALEERSP
jgi:flavin reductase (DIM6/NTAB) family NADH-FMN oxidoreductase RutF